MSFFDVFTKEKENSLINIFPGFEKTQPRQIKFQHFSDGLVIYVPLGNRHELSAISAVYGVLLACGYLTLLGLAQKRPVRIGISVGLGTEVDDEIYGKVLADAYIAESKIAQMPRAVVTNDVLGYINFKSNGEVEGIGEKFEALLAGECKKLLSYDYDGHVIVDYLSDDFTNLLIKGGGLSETVIPEAYKFIQEQLELHQSQQNSKLAMRYSLLHGYFSEYLGK